MKIMQSLDTFRDSLDKTLPLGTRSTALQPLAWLSGILTSGLVVAATSSAPTWVLICIASFFGLSVSVYLIIYVHFARKNPDALRSERYTLSKMAIEKDLIGDDKSGLKETDESDNARSRPSPPSE